MRKRLALLATWLALLGAPAHADLCESIEDTITTTKTSNDVDFYEQLFPNPAYHGNRRWNEIVLQCNRQRDTHGSEIARITSDFSGNPDRAPLQARNLEPKVIRGHFNFFGTIATQLKYVYVLSKQDGVWQMTIPYEAILNDVVEDRVDFLVGRRDVLDEKANTVSAVSQDGHAWQLYDSAQVTTGPDAQGRMVTTLLPGARSIALTQCTTATFQAGKRDKYDGQNDALAYKRDKENKFIDKGKIQYRYKDHDWIREGCRVDRRQELFWEDPTNGRVVKSRPEDWILDNFVRVTEAYWSIPKTFQLRLLLRGRNDAAFTPGLLRLLEPKDRLTIRFATRFMPHGYNQMYKSNLVQFNNFSTMTTDGTYLHEVGHAFGLDDEYARETKAGIPKKDGCENPAYARFDPTTYQMCSSGVADRRTIYHYIAVSRYITKQKGCGNNADCRASEYCDKGVLTVGKNQCVALKADDATCDIAAGGRECRSGKCHLGRCYTPNSVAMGGTCYTDAACSAGKCSAVDGTRGRCVCNSDNECGQGRYCNAGADLALNSCIALKADNETCDLVGGGHQCASGACRFGRCYTPNSVAMGGTCYNDDACSAGQCSALDGTRGTCVCSNDNECGPGKWCDAGFDTKVNACHLKLNAGQSCGTAGSVGNDHKCKSGECSGFPNYKCK